MCFQETFFVNALVRCITYAFVLDLAIAADARGLQAGAKFCDIPAVKGEIPSIPIVPI